MNCEKYLDLISARLDSHLTAQEEGELNAHLQQCPACRAIAQDLAGLHSVLSDLGEADAPAELSQTVMSKIKAERAAARRRFVRRLSGLAACLVLCVGVLRIADARYSDLTRPAEASHLPGVARHMEPQPLTLSADLSYSNVQQLRLSALSTSFAPTADLLGSTEAVAQCLARFPYDDLTSVIKTYNEEYFRTHRLLAVVVYEPSSSITHTLSELTPDNVTLLRHVPEAGDSDMALWLILAEVDGTGPETPLTVDLLTN